MNPAPLLFLRFLTGTFQRDLLRCSRLVVADSQFSLLLGRIRWAEGH